MTRHDPSYRLLFSNPYLVASLLRGFVPGAWLESVDFSTLEPVHASHTSDDLRDRHNDLIWRLRFKGGKRWVYVYLLLEFQSTDAPFMAVRIMAYEALLYQDLIRQFRLRRGSRLPLILPLVLYNGRAPWRAPAEVAELIHEQPEELLPYRPRLQYLVLDERRLVRERREQLAAMGNPVACLFRLEGSVGPREVPPIVEQLSVCLGGDEHEELRQAFVSWLVHAFLPSRVPGAVVPQVQKLEEVTTMLEKNESAWTETWVQQGIQKGIEQGIEQGIEKGIEQGIEKGIEQGIERGRREGEAALLLRQLERKFGALDDAVRERVIAADSDQLLEWGVRLITAPSLESLLDF